MARAFWLPVDAEFVHRDRHGGEGGDAVDDEQHVGVFFNHGAEFRQRAHHARGGLVVNKGDGVEFAGGKLGVEQFRQDRLTPFHLEPLGLLAAALGNVEPFVGKRAAHAVEHFLGDEIANGAFHHTPRGGGGEEHRLFGAEKGLELRMNGRVELLEVVAAVADHRLAESGKGFLRNFDRARDEELGVRHGMGSKME